MVVSESDNTSPKRNYQSKTESYINRTKNDININKTHNITKNTNNAIIKLEGEKILVDKYNVAK